MLIIFAYNHYHVVSPIPFKQLVLLYYQKTIYVYKLFISIYILLFLIELLYMSDT